MGKVCIPQILLPFSSVLRHALAVISRAPLNPFRYAILTADANSSVKGITSKLDYLQRLGIDIVWVSPSQFLSLCTESSLNSDSIQKSTESESALEPFYRA